MIKFELMSLCGVTREVLLKTGAALSSCVAVGSLDMEAVCCAWGGPRSREPGVPTLQCWSSAGPPSQLFHARTRNKLVSCLSHYLGTQPN